MVLPSKNMSTLLSRCRMTRIVNIMQFGVLIQILMLIILYGMISSILLLTADVMGAVITAAIRTVLRSAKHNLTLLILNLSARATIVFSAVLLSVLISADSV